MTEVNGVAYTVLYIDSTSFSIVDTTTFTAYTSGGRATAQLVVVVVVALLERQVKFNLVPVAAHLMATQHLHGIVLVKF
jgi:hypothetical protein